jgi:hypothetical protein
MSELRLSDVIGTLPEHLPVEVLNGPLEKAIATLAAGEIKPARPFPVSSDEHKLNDWVSMLLERAEGELHAKLPLRAKRAWSFWLDAIKSFVKDENPRSGDQRPQFDDLVLTAAGLLPSRLMRYHLSQVNGFGWTELVLVAVASQWVRPERSELVEYAPAWAALAGLCILGFGRRTLESLIGKRPNASDADQFIEAFGTDRNASSGTLVVASTLTDPLPPSHPYLVPPSHPYLIMTLATLERYGQEVAWLRESGVIERCVYERAKLEKKLREILGEDFPLTSFAFRRPNTPEESSTFDEEGVVRNPASLNEIIEVARRRGG